MKERRAAIRKYIETRGEVTISELATAFSKWSEMTLRRDLASLAEDQLVILTRGGARAFPVRYGLSEDIYTEREMRNNPAKSEIAQKALAFVEAGKGIFLDSGTTVMALAKNLPDYNMVVVTAAPNVAMEIVMRKENPSVVQLGGILSRRSIAVADPRVDQQLSSLNIDTAFLGASGFDEHAGFSVGSQSEGMLKSSVAKRARRVVMLLDSSKIGTMLPFSFAQLADIDLLITDSDFPSELKKKFENLVKII